MVGLLFLCSRNRLRSPTADMIMPPPQRSPHLYSMLSVSPPVTIRPFQANEWRAYRDLRLRALQEAPEAFCSTFASARQIPDADWQARLAHIQPDHDYPIAALLAEQPVAMAWVTIDRNHPTHANLFQMWVAPEYRGQGVGRQVVQAAIAWARDRQLQSLHLGVTVGDTPARHLYESLGFVAVGELEPLRSGSGLMLQNMTLALNTPGMMPESAANQ
jgi:ribosomal protein S18 acetylase RimI-like enzyme